MAGYVDGFVVPVPKKNVEAYRRMAQKAGKIWREHGALEFRECVADQLDVPMAMPFPRRIKLKPDETLFFSWIVYKSRAHRDRVNKKVMADPRIAKMDPKTMPFDGKRMIYGGFESIVDEADGDRGGYLDGYLVPVPEGNKEAYREMAQKAAQVFKEYGATRVVEAWGDDVPDGEVTDYKRAVKARKDERIVYSWVEWPDKATRVEGWKKVMEDPRMQPGQGDMPFDGKRLIYGGFVPIVDR